MKHFTYRPSGVCSQLIEIDAENGVIENVQFMGGCNGNLQGISALVKGLPVESAIEKLSGIRCGFKDTSCPDQLSRALQAMQEEA